MTVRTMSLEITLNEDEQKELKPFLKHPFSLIPCSITDLKRVRVLESLEQKGYIEKELERNGYIFYKTIGD